MSRVLHHAQQRRGALDEERVDGFGVSVDFPSVEFPTATSLRQPGRA
jgi:hypothetical protein